MPHLSRALPFLSRALPHLSRPDTSLWLLPKSIVSLSSSLFTADSISGDGGVLIAERDAPETELTTTMSASSSERPLQQLEAKIGYKFVNSSLLVEAMTHKSFVNENPGSTCNERLEHLGDTVLDLIVTEELFLLFPNDSEAKLTENRKLLVNEAACENLAKSIELGRYLRLGQGEHLLGGRQKPALLADSFEALVGAIHFDSGFDLSLARKVVMKVYGPLNVRLEGARVVDVHNANFKSQLQEYVQARTHGANVPICYALTGRTGPDHKPTFNVTVRVENFEPKFSGQGEGRSRREAEQKAAMDLLDNFHCHELLQEIKAIDGDEEERLRSK